MKKTIFMIFLFSPVLSHADWHLAYKSDVQGNVVHGNICTLLNYVKNGYDVKVVVDGENQQTNTSWHVSITPTAVAYKENYVYVRAEPMTSEYYNKDGVIDFVPTKNINDLYRAESMVDNQGRLITITYSLNGDRLTHNKTVTQVATKWFVDTASPILANTTCQ
ncbi:hypothetical protein [Aeromonas veronii]|uniref:hypothetical protein n=1 Tax=Aeromonas veronii TaxID=654 RepID=UPI003BA31215